MPAPLKDMGSASELQGQNPHREPKMTLEEFRQSLAATEPPAELTHALAGLWWEHLPPST
jgi:hypothetical protein